MRLSLSASEASLLPGSVALVFFSGGGGHKGGVEKDAAKRGGAAMGMH